MLAPRTRREFLADVGRGALVASVGWGLASDLGFVSAGADEGPERLEFGPLEPLVALMQETPLDRLLPALVERLRAGTDLRHLVAAAALANARTFGGEDYVGFHTMMAIAPAYRMAAETPEPRRPLPVLKVLYRNTARIQEFGGRKSEVLRAVPPGGSPAGNAAGEEMRDLVRAKDVGGAERALAALARRSPGEALDGLLYAVDDYTEVHRVVLPHRAWDLLDVIGKEHALTLLRQSVHYCVKEERGLRGPDATKVRTLLPELLEEHHLLGREPGTQPADNAALDRLEQAIFGGTPEEAADAAAAALAGGMAPAAVGEAVSLAANQLLLRDAGRTARDEKPGKPAGSVHGDSIGVHASDSANAWRSLAHAGSARNTFACLILGAYQASLDRTGRGGDFASWRPHPLAEESEKVAAAEPDVLLREADAAIREKQQGRVTAVLSRYGQLGHPPGPAFDLLRGYATSEDGALHAEKYFRTASEEFAATRPAFCWRHAVALGRVTASEYGQRAAGIEEAARLLKA